jgi:uncharacterized protein YdaU (DUF1376 family)
MGIAMAKNADIWMPIYIGDYLSATSRLTTEQHGAYFLLLMDYWKCGPPPDDDQVLAQITRMSPDAWRNARSILQAFFQVSDKHWLHERVEREMAAASERQAKAVKRAKAGSEARWAKNQPENASSIAQALPNPMLVDASSPSPSSSPLPLQSKEKSKSASAPAPEKPNGKGSRIPFNELPDEWTAFCRDERPELNPLKVWASFHDYWIAVPGAKGVKTDWFATWRNWVRNQRQTTTPKQRKDDSWQAKLASLNTIDMEPSNGQVLSTDIVPF